MSIEDVMLMADKFEKLANKAAQAAITACDMFEREHGIRLRVEQELREVREERDEARSLVREAARGGLCFQERCNNAARKWA